MYNVIDITEILKMRNYNEMVRKMVESFVDLSAEDRFILMEKFYNNIVLMQAAFND